MKKRITGILLALVMLAAMSTTAFAATGKNSDSGTITINNAAVGETYSIYQILALESYDNTNNSYLYKVTDSNWKTFLTAGDGKDYVTVDDNGYVTWKGDQKDSRVAEFAKKALAYAEANSIAATKSVTATGTTVKFTGLNLGYYLIDSSLGALCALDTTNPDATVKEKNEGIIVDKEVQEDNNWGNENDAFIGDTVAFQVTINLKVGSQNVVFHDTMGKGLTFDPDSVEVKVNGTALAAENYMLNKTPSDGYTFEVSFKQDYLDSLTEATDVVITYSATVNEEADPVAGTVNEGKVTYGNSQAYTSSSTTTHTWKFDVFKYTGTEENKTPLADAKFSLYKDEECTEASIVKFDEVSATEYRYNKTGTVTEITTGSTGKFTLTGLDSGTYYLKETEAPDGYNQLSDPIKVVIGKDGSVTYGDNADASTDKTVGVLNQSGAELPSTGGMGTTLFYVIGGILVVGAAVLLVVKRRMNGAER